MFITHGFLKGCAPLDVAHILLGFTGRAIIVCLQKMYPVRAARSRFIHPTSRLGMPMRLWIDESSVQEEEV